MNTSINIRFRQFSSALHWNALAYTAHKCAFTLQTFLLYRFLSPTDFSMWATTNSTIFLLLLWLDLGLRKSIPRYAPFFRSNCTQVIKKIMILQQTALVLALPFLLWFLSGYTTPSILILASIVYLTQGAQTIMRLVYHSYFYNRSFNSLDTLITITEVTVISVLIIYLPSYTLLLATFAIKAIASLTLTIISHCSMPTQAVSTIETQQAPVDMPYFEFDKRMFIKHSLVMWVTTIIKSFSERNFLLLLLTSTTGIATANFFKLANDGALFFYRIIIKTIGVADTALLAHVQAEHTDTKYQDTQQQNRMMIYAVKEVVSKISRLVLPLLGGIVIMSLLQGWVYQAYVFHAFLIMAIGYVVETILLPYERLLEVEQKYTFLFISYIPYIVVMTLLVLVIKIPSIGFVPFLLIVQSVRLVSYILIRFFVYIIYRI